ncbi:repressor LexA [bacterium]|mgnify:FL=1|nr:repressor LexA [bacterium]MBT6831739.1 repressor LexA [bacterium]MBT6996562.1 repressor LexA [bacterium]MBT7772888.1 repressor LexA [bacterium]
MTENLTAREADALREIRSAIRLMGKFPSVRELMTAMGYRSPRSTAVILKKLETKNFLTRGDGGKLKLVKNSDDSLDSADTVDIPVVGNVRCGVPSFAEENIESFVRVSTRLAPRDQQHFLLRAVGDSMNEANIQPGDLVLVRVQKNAENGDRVVALVDDEATIKEFHRRENVVVLTPRSSNPRHQPIIVTDQLQIQGVVVTSIPTV